MEKNNNSRFIELLNDLESIANEMKISELNIPEEDKELLFSGLYNTKCFIGNAKRLVINKSSHHDG